MGDVVRDKNKTCKCVVSHCIQRDTVTQKVSHVHKDTITYGHVRKGKKAWEWFCEARKCTVFKGTV